MAEEGVVGAARIGLRTLDGTIVEASPEDVVAALLDALRARAGVPGLSFVEAGAWRSFDGVGQGTRRVCPASPEEADAWAGLWAARDLLKGEGT